MSSSLRIYYGKEKGLAGRCRMNFNTPAISRTSIVLITAGEATDQQQVFGLQPYDFNLGDADVWVSNISPHDGGVEFILHVQWGTPLNIVVDITVLDTLSAPGQFVTA